MRIFCQVVVVDVFNPNTQEAEAGRSLSSRIARLHTMKPCLQSQKNIQVLNSAILGIRILLLLCSIFFNLFNLFLFVFLLISFEIESQCVAQANLNLKSSCLCLIAGKPFNIFSKEESRFRRLKSVQLV